MFYIYMALVAFFCLIFVLNMFQEPKVMERVSYALLLIPFLLRLLGLK
jgi:hypothetical protein